MRGAEKWRGHLSREFDSAINLTPVAGSVPHLRATRFSGYRIGRVAQRGDRGGHIDVYHSHDGPRHSHRRRAHDRAFGSMGSRPWWGQV